MPRSAQLFRFFKNLLLFALIFFLADRLIGSALKGIYFSLKKGQFAQTTYSIDSTENKDILIFGSSRAIRHYSPSIISKTFNLECYNVGRDGEFMPYYAAIKDIILKKNKPKLIILDVNVWEFAPNGNKYEKLSILLPYVPTHPELKKYVNKISAWENLKLNSLTYLYNSTVFISVHDLIFNNNIPKDDNGYMPLSRTVSKEEFEDYKRRKEIYDKKRTKKRIDIDLESVDYYRNFLDETRKLGIKTYVIISPTILQEPNTREKVLIETIAKEYSNVIFMDYSNNPLFNNKYKLFSDPFHLNATGSAEFTKDLVKSITLN